MSLVTRGLGEINLVVRGFGSVTTVVPVLPDSYGDAQGRASTVDDLTIDLGLVAEIEASFETATLAVDVTESGALVVITSPAFTKAVSTISRLTETSVTAEVLGNVLAESISPDATGTAELEIDAAQSTTAAQTTVVASVDSTITAEEQV